VTDTYVLILAGLAAGLIGPIVSALLISRHAGLNLWLLGVKHFEAESESSAGLSTALRPTNGVVTAFTLLRLTQ
jgi:type IV secretory pathway TrbD component